MGQRFQVYVNYGKNDEAGKAGENLFAMHLQWCWGHFAIVRAHQLISFLDGARQNAFNPFGLGEYGRIGGNSFDGRREDLYLLRALTEINYMSSSIVEGHDLMKEENDDQERLFEKGELKSFPGTIQIEPLAQDNNDGFLVIRATENEVRYAFCKDTSAIEPVNASGYLDTYRSEIKSLDANSRTKIKAFEETLKGYPLLTKDEVERIFEKSYDKKLNIENFREPEQKLCRHEPLSEVTQEAKCRVEKARQLPRDESRQNQQNNKERSGYQR